MTAPIYEIGEPVYRQIEMDNHDSGASFSQPTLSQVVKIRADTVGEDLWLYTYFLRAQNANDVMEVLENEIISRKEGELILTMTKQNNLKAANTAEMGASTARFLERENLKLKVQIQMSQADLEEKVLKNEILKVELQNS